MPLPPATAFRPLGLRIASRGFQAAWARRLLPPPDLREETLLGQAARVAGTDDFGADFKDGGHARTQLRALLPSLRDEARLNPLGRMIAHGQILKVLTERARAVQLFRAHPHIDAWPLPPPVVIVGPMRSGTTRLQRLLACDPRFTALKLHEAMFPVPPLRGRDPGPGRTTAGLWLVNSVNPGNAAVHPTSARAVDEELGLLEQSFAGAQIEAQRRVPSFARAGEAADQTPAYVYLARLLRLRGWATARDPTLPFVLKTPQHMQDLAALDAVFPRARLIFIHRDPAAVVGSAASLAWNQMVVQSDHVDPAWIGAEWLHKTAHRMAVTGRVRAGIARARQLDVTFAEMDMDWPAVMRRVYAWLDLELTPAVLAAMRNYVAGAKRHRAHRYALADFGLSEGAVRERLGADVSA